MPSKKTVLIVEDEVYILHILDFAFGMEGYRTMTSTSGQLALTKAQQHLPDLIVLDASLRDIDGYTVCRLLKHHHVTSHIPVLLMSGKGKIIEQKICEELGAAYLCKPFSPRKMVEIANRILKEG